MTVSEILTNVKKAKAIDYVELLNKNNTDKDHLADKSRIEELLRKNYLKGSTEPYSTITLTNKGQCLLDELQKIADQQAEKEKQNRFQKKISIASVLVPCVTFVLGLIVEHCASIICFFLQLFR